jgi:hypothetical protein
MTTALSIIDWITSLNSWQLTFWITVGASAWFVLFEFAWLVMTGGYAGDKCDDDAEGGR